MIDTLTSRADDLWWRLPEADRESVRGWLRDHGIDPDNTTQVHLTAEGAVEVVERLLDDEGRPYLDSSGEALVTRTRTVPVSHLPAAWPLAGA